MHDGHVSPSAHPSTYEMRCSFFCPEDDAAVSSETSSCGLFFNNELERLSKDAVVA
jgi:hypothetical protein